ncbi:hypothetical protein CKO38_10790 [Rhodospirillum rubrum]|nr:hypothetical protein [Rhodospirillum rubrum]MBK1677141.1 hypothetical protein [Rhodospirillum rubrum]
MTPLLLLVGTLLSAAFVGLVAVLGQTLDGPALTAAVALVGLPLVGHRVWRQTAPHPVAAPVPNQIRRMPRAPGAERGRINTGEIIEAFEALDVALLGRGERPFAFETLAEARRTARRYLNSYGVITCDGLHFLTTARIEDRELARAYIRNVYALDNDAPGRPIIPVAGRVPCAPLRVPSVPPLPARMVDTRKAMRMANALERPRSTASSPSGSREAA